ncbi:MAG: CRISPR-associated protein Cas4 [Lachnospiraceae bacterium]|jgi:CRISPR-associated exonuclease Cas4|nr:CRISPR-associated protein Cas4 [Lachnospiraceae bacterium]MCI1657030.1 CRISPR-associated protein Cas4 [Lachnospiraceae bacterium]MCI2195545.1 CRISPR-associated protein Cas4 [Lachnospiraceae bacterium]
MKNEIIGVSIRELQHYLYCPHRWGLININCSWEENVFVVKANMIHKRVHDPNQSYSAKNKKVLTSVAVYNDQLGLYGIADCIEIKKNKNGVLLPGFGTDTYSLNIVEYKPRKPKTNAYNYDDFIQVFAQKVCVDSIFKCNATGTIFYADCKQRIVLPLEEEKYIDEIADILQEIREYIKRGVIPPIKKNQKCQGCSLKDICMPKINKKSRLSNSLGELYKDEKTT